jgi:UrcA family protein
MNMSKMDGRLAGIMACAVLGLAGLSAMANSSQAGETDAAAPRITVKYADLDLSNKAGIAVLYQRIEAAAFHVCGSVESRELAQRGRAKTCQDQAISQAVASINKHLLTAEHLAKTGQAQQTETLAEAL